MDNKFKYRFDSLTGILFKYYFGLINIDDIVSSWEYAFTNNLIPEETKGFVLDYRNSNLNIKVEEHKDIVEFYKNHLEIFGNLKIAILTENSKDIVIPILVQNNDDGYFSKPFSTLESAIDWVLN